MCLLEENRILAPKFAVKHHWKKRNWNVNLVEHLNPSRESLTNTRKKFQSKDFSTIIGGISRVINMTSLSILFQVYPIRSFFITSFFNTKFFYYQVFLIQVWLQQCDIVNLNLTKMIFYFLSKTRTRQWTVPNSKDWSKLN